MKDRKHLYWVVGLTLITLIVCGTLLWVNSHSWIIRFEMDDNTKEAVESIEWDVMNEKNQKIETWKNCEGGMILGGVNITYEERDGYCCDTWHFEGHDAIFCDKIESTDKTRRAK